MKTLTSHEIEEILRSRLPENSLLDVQHELPQPSFTLQAEALVEACTFLRDDSRTYFDFLNCLSGIDSGPESNRLGVVYHLSSIPHGHRIVLKVWTSRDGKNPIPSVAQIWRTAEWHEREAFDLVGIPFSGHPDLRRILMPDDWEGHPLRKDYENPESYHGIQIQY
jgi:NADH-quinone oxidoreductase subunit C